MLDASKPGQFPAQDNVDRANQVVLIARLGIDESWMESNNGNPQPPPTQEFHAELPNLIKATIDEQFPVNRFGELDGDHYQVGPAAGGMVDLSHFIITILEQSDQITNYLDDVETYWFYFSIARGVKRKATEWLREQRIPGVHVVFTYSPEDIKHLASGYVSTILNDEPKGEAFIHCLTEDYYDGYQSPAHPTESLEYLVIVAAEKASYRFRVMGDSRILELVVEDSAGAKAIESLEYLDNGEVVE